MDVYLITKGPKGSFRTYVGSLYMDGVQYLEDMLNVGFRFDMSATESEVTAAGREVELRPIPFEDKDETRLNWHQKMQDFLDKQSEGIVDPPVYDDCVVTSEDVTAPPTLQDFTNNVGCDSCAVLAIYPCHLCHSFHNNGPCDAVMELINGKTNSE